MRNILLTNDDGVFAPGIDGLYNSLSKNKNYNIMVMAPLEERSTTGHTLSLDSPLRMKQLKEKYFGCSGYPADCVLLANGTIFKESGIDLVISGINRGANLGQDVYYSGTVAAAREATFHNIPSVSISLNIDLYKENQQLHYESAVKVVDNILEKNILKKLPPMNILNINVPNIKYESLKGHSHTFLGFRYYGENISKRIDFRKRDYYWIGGNYKGHNELDGTDCVAVDNSRVSYTLLNVSPFSIEKDNNAREEFVSLINSL